MRRPGSLDVVLAGVGGQGVLSAAAVLSTAAMEAGKHVLLQKPMATNSEDCRKLIAAAAERNLTLELDDGVYDYLIDEGVSDTFGARELRRAVDRHLRQPLAEEVLKRGGSVGTVRVSRGSMMPSSQSRADA